MSKYKAKKTKVDGITFDSKKEAERYRQLKMLENARHISDLELQKKFVLIPSQKVDGKIKERECSYRADFTYIEDGRQIVEDTKGFKTDSYIIKRKLMLERHGIEVKEI